MRRRPDAEMQPISQQTDCLLSWPCRIWSGPPRRQENSTPASRRVRRKLQVKQERRQGSPCFSGETKRCWRRAFGDKERKRHRSTYHTLTAPGLGISHRASSLPCGQSFDRGLVTRTGRLGESAMAWNLPKVARVDYFGSVTRRVLEGGISRDVIGARRLAGRRRGTTTAYNTRVMLIAAY